MQVIVAGCGAMGSVFAAGVVRSGHTVQVYQRRGATFDALQRQGGIRLKNELIPVAGVTDKAEELDPSDLIIILVKAYSTSEMHPLGGLLKENGAVLTLQNGLGNAEALAEIFGGERVAAGVATYAAFALEPGKVQPAGSGLVSLGPWNPARELSWVADVIRAAGFETEYVDDPRPYIWRKLAINAMVNTTAALTRLRNGLLRENEQVRALMRQLGEEAVEAARRAGVRVDFDGLWKFHLENLQKTGANRASMLQDVEAGRLTEIDGISGAVLKYAGSEDEFPYTRTVYHLIKGIDNISS